MKTASALTATLALMGLSACSDEAPAAPAAQTVPAAETVTVTPAPKTEAEATAGIAGAAAVGPESFIRAVYGVYDDAVPEEASGFPAAIWSARTRALWAENDRAQEAAGGIVYEGQLCECNDFTGFKVDTVAVTPEGADRASAAVTSENGGKPLHQVLKLVREQGLWRIDDVKFDPAAEYPQPDMVEGLKKALAEANAPAEN